MGREGGEESRALKGILQLAVPQLGEAILQLALQLALVQSEGLQCVILLHHLKHFLTAVLNDSDDAVHVRWVRPLLLLA